MPCNRALAADEGGRMLAGSDAGHVALLQLQFTKDGQADLLIASTVVIAY